MLTRRHFLFYGGATAAGVTLGEAGRRTLAWIDNRESLWSHKGAERLVTSVCRECPAGCGVVARVVNGVPVKLEGNPLCPIARGRLCANGQAAIESYFDPDRLVGPVRRVGRRGNYRWERVSWETGIQLVASRLGERSLPEPRRPVAIAAEERGAIAEHWIRCWRGAGARIACSAAPIAARFRPALSALTGTTMDPVFDLEHASHVLSFEAPLVETWLSPVWAQRSYGRFRRTPSRTRGRLVHFEPRRSPTARKADEWLAATTEQQIVLAYGLASIILRENRGRQDFLETFGGNWQTFERAVTSTYTPDDVAEATGVPVVTLLRLAREISASALPLVVVRADAPPALIDAVLALNGLLGAFDRPGGIYASPQPAIDHPDDAREVLREIAAGHLRPNLLVFRDASALCGLDAAVGLDAVEDATLVVSLSPYLDELARVADLILPTHTALETWHALVPPAATRGSIVAVARPAVSPRLETRDLADLLYVLTNGSGPPATKTPAAASLEMVVQAEVGRLYGARRGTPYGSPYEIDWVGQLERGGLWVPAASSRQEFETKVLDAGGWIDPFFDATAIRQRLRARQGLTFTLPRGIPPAPAAIRVVEHQPARSAPDEKTFPLRLVSFVPAAVQLSANHNQPVLFELIGQPDTAPWRTWIEMSPDTARAHEITPGRRVRVHSPHGVFSAVAVLVDGMAPDTVAAACLPFNGEGGRWVRMLDYDVRAVLAQDEPGRTRVRLSLA